MKLELDKARAEFVREFWVTNICGLAKGTADLQAKTLEIAAREAANLDANCVKPPSWGEVCIWLLAAAAALREGR